MLAWLGRGLVRLGAALAAPRRRSLGYHSPGRPVPPDGNPTSEALAFCQSSAIYACVMAYTRAFAEPALGAYRGNELVTDERDLVAELAAQPNRDMDPVQYSQRIASDLKLSGEFIAHLWRSRSGGPDGRGVLREIVPLRGPAPVPREDGEIEHYEVRGQAPIDPRDVLHIRLPHPRNDYRGLSPLTVLWVERLISREALGLVSDWLQNGGAFDLALISPQQVSVAEREEIQAQYLEQRGPGGRRNTVPLILSHGTTVHEMGADLHKLELAPITDMIEALTAAVIGVPAVIAGLPVGIKQYQAYGSLREAKTGWVEQVLLPDWQMVASAHTHKIRSEFGRDRGLWYMVEQVQAVKRVQDLNLRNAVSAYYANVMYRDQALEYAGLDPVDDGERVYRIDQQARAQVQVEQEKAAIEEGDASAPKGQATRFRDSGTGVEARHPLPELVPVPREGAA